MEGWDGVVGAEDDGVADDGGRLLTWVFKVLEIVLLDRLRVFGGREKDFCDKSDAVFLGNVPRHDCAGREDEDVAWLGGRGSSTVFARLLLLSLPLMLVLIVRGW